MRSLPVVYVLLVSLAAAQGEEKKPPASPKLATLEVTVRWDGTAPKPKPLRIDETNRGFSDEAVRHCKKCIAEGTLLDESLLVSEKGGIRNVAVSLPRILDGAKSRAVKTNTLPVGTLDNANCRFEPHVQFAPVGKALRLKNSDMFTHNARFAPKGKASVWNGIVLPEKTVEGPRFLRAGIYEVTCDAHPWMRGYVIASKTPHCGVTDQDGKVTVAGIDAAGRQSFVFWHESLGVARQEVELERGKTVRIRLSHKDFR